MLVGPIAIEQSLKVDEGMSLYALTSHLVKKELCALKGRLAKCDEK